MVFRSWLCGLHECNLGDLGFYLFKLNNPTLRFFSALLQRIYTCMFSGIKYRVKKSNFGIERGGISRLVVL